jgi:hypothetical protein
MLFPATNNAARYLPIAVTIEEIAGFGAESQ